VKDARLQTLKAEFDALRMKEEEPLDQYAGKLTTMSVKYGNLGGGDTGRRRSGQETV
jgi:hypothetical protein